MIQKYQSGKKVTPRKRKGNVVQPSGKVSTHKMAREYVEGRGWVAFPTLFQDDNGKWYDLSGSKNWEEVYEFAKNRGEVYDFGEDVQAAIEFADIGSSWKKDMSMNKKVKKYQEGRTVRDFTVTDSGNAHTRTFSKNNDIRGALLKLFSEKHDRKLVLEDIILPYLKDETPEIRKKVKKEYKKGNYEKALDAFLEEPYYVDELTKEDITRQKLDDSLPKVDALEKMMREYGVRNIRTRNNRISGTPSYDFTTNTIYSNHYGPLISEMSHAVQDQQNVGGVLRAIRDWKDNPYFNIKGYKKQYKEPGSLEYEAHEIIEPLLREQYNDTLLKMNKEVKKYQAGGAPSLEDILGGNFSFADLFGSMTGVDMGAVPNINQTYDYNGQEMSEEDYLRETYQDQIDAENPAEKMKWWEYGAAVVQPGYTLKRIREERKKKKAREKGYAELEEDIASGDIYDQDETQGIMNDARIANMNEYMQSDEFKSGLQMIGTQFGDIQKQMKAEKFNQPVDHRPFMVGEDRGIRMFKKGGGIHIKPENRGKFTAKANRAGRSVQSHARHVLANKEDYPSSTVKQANFARNAAGWKKQEGGQVSTPQFYLSLFSGHSKEALDRYARAVREHESFSDYQRLQDSGGPGRGAYQFEGPALITAAKKARKIYEEYGGEAPEVYSKIINKEIKDATQLSPEIQDELFYSTMFKFVPVTDKKGKVKNYRLDITPTLLKSDITTPGGMANAWQVIHNRGKKDRTAEFLTSLERTDLFKMQAGGPVNPFMNPGFMAKYSRAENGDIVVDGDGNQYQKGSDSIQPSLLGYKDSSPDRFNRMNRIPGGNITMKDVSIPLLLKPNKGKPMVALPNSGNYKFPGADYVDEIPLRKFGGMINKYQQGGVMPIDVVSQDFDDQIIPMEEMHRLQYALNTPGYTVDTNASFQDFKKMAEDKNVPNVTINNKSKGGGLITIKEPDGTTLRLKQDKDGNAVPADEETKKIIEEQQRKVNASPQLAIPQKGIWEEGVNEKGNLFQKRIMQEGGEVDPDQPVPIQAEKGEMVMFQDGTVTPVKAKKRHKRMKDDEVTDVLPPGSYVFSNDKNLKLDKKLADEISFGFGPTVYSENEISEAPREMFFGEMFKKKQETPAEVAKNIKRKFPVTDLEGDIYAERAKVENKMSRMPYLAMLKHMNDAKRGSTPPGQMMQYGGQTMSPLLQRTMPPSAPQPPMPRVDNAMKTAQSVRPVTSPRFVPKAQTGLEAMMIGGIGDAIGGIASAYQNAQAQKRIKQNQAKTEQDLEDFYGRATGRAQQQLGIEAGSAFAQMALQDPTYSRMNLDAVRSRTQNAFADREQELQAQQQLTASMQQAPINSAYRSMAGSDPRMAAANASAMNAQYLRESGATALGFADRISNTRLQGQDALNRIDLMDIQDKQRGDMYEKAARNTLGATFAKGMGAAGTTYMSRLGQADLTQVAGKMGARNQTMSALNNLTALQNQNFKDIGSGIGDTAAGVYAQWQGSQQPNINDFSPQDFDTISREELLKGLGYATEI